MKASELRPGHVFEVDASAPGLDAVTATSFPEPWDESPTHGRRIAVVGVTVRGGKMVRIVIAADALVKLRGSR